MNRRQFLRRIGLGATSVALGANRCSAFARPSAANPNLLVIQTDEHNFRTLGCYRDILPADQAFVWGDGVAVETPNIDSLAKNGVLCANFYATTPVCSPSRATFVSGRYPQNTPVVTNNIPMDDETVTFAKILRRNGYATGYAGKWHLDGKGKPQWAPDRKFGFEDNRYMFNRGHWKQLEDTPAGPRVKARNAKGRPSYAIQGADEESFTTDFLTDKTVAFIEAHKNDPWCFMVSLPDPHGPNTVRPPYDRMFQHLQFKAPRTMTAPIEDLPSWGKKQADKLNAKQMALYFGMVKCIDDNVGKILGALRRAGILENTIVVFTSDHGDLCGEHGRHNKGVPFETSAKIPSVIHYPPKIKAGTVIRQALSSVDFLPTVINLMGFRTPGREQGRDASRLLTTGKTPSKWKDIVFLRSTGGQKNAMTWLAAVTPRYKFIVAAHDDPWLFDLREDPDELSNFFRDPRHRRTIRELSGALLEYGRRYDDPYISHPAISADLAWGVSEREQYLSPRDPTDVVQVAAVPLIAAHAHNDYEHERPLLDALAHGFTSVEADIFLVGDKLLVAHDRSQVRPDRTLESLYLDPLRKRARRNAGRVYPNGPQFTLLVDVKSEAAPTYTRLHNILAEYEDIITSFDRDGVKEQAVLVIISGNRPRALMQSQELRHAGYDGRLADLHSGAPATFIPLISDNWTTHFTWRGIGPMPPDEHNKLTEIVRIAHSKGRRVRFWATPDTPSPTREALWTELLSASVDLINTDDLPGLQQFLLRKQANASR